MFNLINFKKMNTVDFSNNVVAKYIRPMMANFNIRVFAMAVCLAGMTVFSGCDKDDDPKEEPDATDSVVAAFKQFGVDLEQVKPNVATPDNTVNQNNCKVSSSVYTARAYYREKSGAAISGEVAVAYKERMFNYIKSISADKKCYRLRLGGNTEEVTAFSDLLNETGAYDDWSYKFNGMWINAITLHYSLGNEIGIDLQGMATY
jgi:hypothetical protein